MGKNFTKEQIERLGATLLEIGSLLMSSGANSMRIRVTLERIANAFGFHSELLITHRALMVNLENTEQKHAFNMLKRTSPHGVNFKLVSGISKMSWNIVGEKWSMDDIDRELERLKGLPHYPRIIILLFVGLADLSFCRLFGGGIVEMLVAFVATFIGLYVRQEAMKLKYNPYLCIYVAALVSSLISGLSVKFNIGTEPHYAFATSVLYLIPGVPLVNSFSDLIYGNIMNGIVRGVNGMMIAFAIALGLASALLIYQI
ncbi:threonine/serine ThrE exporter family protein [Plebeiibacterium sediminum]|uniref:Threonine/serine exporter family protein n=1 Tax=Plebeiibacterium sediminum TaxID=2992112 RepID=A0AAE3M8H9_9BACT|nr:threonine/serine exporter family protein [Plebeiobacterium sediminum]MCW3789038.1 threonine/serine exporter family protein [Plebeiobacterium sediminum]